MLMKKNKLNRPLNVGVVGATGMVGKSFMETLEQRSFPVGELRPFASELSLGKAIELSGTSYPIQVLKPGCFEGLDLVFFSSGDDISKEWAPQAVKAGAWAVDNSAAFRLDSAVQLIVPEVNGSELDRAKSPQIIANPNCSTIQLVMALKPLSDQFGLEAVKVSTYQAVSGAGQAAYDELLNVTEATIEWLASHDEVKIRPENSVFPKPIAFNCIPQVGSFNEQGFTSEEMKIMLETRKILALPKLKISAFTVRVPVLNSHAESVWVTLKSEVQRSKIAEALAKFEGNLVQDEPSKSIYPIQSEVSGKDPVYIGRIHQDLDDPKTWLLWVVSDNIRKGAALNGLQIAERIFDIH
jgi:aspartate-semialdehyde dehydrogenase